MGNTKLNERSVRNNNGPSELLANSVLVRELDISLSEVLLGGSSSSGSALGILEIGTSGLLFTSLLERTADQREVYLHADLTNTSVWVLVLSFLGLIS